MKRLLQILLVVLLTSAALAGCMHGDDDDDGGTPTPTPTNTPGTNNTTPNQAPIPMIEVSLEASGAAINGPPFAVQLGAPVNITFDSNASSDQDGSITGVSWVVQPPSGDAHTSTNRTFTVDLGQIKKEKFGVWTMTLRVTDGSAISILTQYFAIDFLNTYTLPDGMAGPGSADRQSNPQDFAASTVHGIGTGTFKVETFPVNADAKAVFLNLTFEAGTGSAQMKLFLFDPSVKTDDDTRTGEPVNETEPSDSPISLVHRSEDDLTNGTWRVRVELVGQRIDSYTLDVKVLYATPTLFGGAGNGTADNGTADNTSSVQMLPLPQVPPTPSAVSDDRGTRMARDGSA